MLGPVVPGATFSTGARVPGTAWQLEPVKAAFNIGCMIRWLDYNDTWLAAEWGHPSDNFGAILALTDFLDRNPDNVWQPGRKWTVRDVLYAAIQAYEIQGVLALENGFNRVGLDHCAARFVSRRLPSLVRYLVAPMSRLRTRLVLAWLDGGALRTLSACPQHGLSQKLGGWRCNAKGCAVSALDHDWRDGLCLGIDPRRDGVSMTSSSKTSRS